MKTAYPAAFAVFLIILSGCSSKIEEKSTACFGEKCFNVGIADSGSERAAGLMFRESLAEDEGMLFVFDDEGIYSFWMKNTLIPLDIIWIDANSTVVFIVYNAQPCKEEPYPSINPGKKARYVLEINAGAAENAGISEGSRTVLEENSNI